MTEPLKRRTLLITAVLILLAFFLLRLVRLAITLRRPQAAGDPPQPDLPNVLPAQPPAETPRQPEPHRAPQNLAAPRRRRPPARPARRKAHFGAEQVLLAVEIGAVFFFVVAGIAVWQTRRELNDTYRSLQQTDPRLLPTLVAAANPGVAAQSLAQANQGSNARSAPPLPTPFPTATPLFVAMANAPAAAAVDGPDAAMSAERQQSDAASSAEDNTDAEWGTTVVMQKRALERDQPRRLHIPAIEVNSFIFQDYGEDWLKLGVVQIAEPVAPGEPGNMVLAAHNDVYGEIFRDLDQLSAGDEVLVSGESQTYTYRVRETLIVEPEDIWVTLPTSTPTLTLVSCYPYLLGTQRIVVFADLVNSAPGQ